MTAQETAGQQIPELATRQRQAFIAGGAGAVLSAIGWLVNAPQFYQSYLLAYMLVLGASLGCLAVAMIHQLSGGGWGILVRRPMGAAARVLPVLTVLFLPIVFGMHHLYIWTDQAVVARDEVLRGKHLYLNIPFFLIRAAFYFLVWNAISYYLNAWSLEQDRTGDPQLALRMQRLSGGGLVAYGFTITFASFDWLMSLEPHWFSTIYGVLIMGGQGLTGLAFLLIVLVWLGRRPPLRDILLPSHYHDLANLTLAFVMLWAYFAFSQYLLIWSGNLPEEISWYTHRMQGGWRGLALALIVFHFAVPFLLLLSRTIKREPQLIVRVAIGILVARWIDLLWLVAPEFHQTGLSVSWMDIVLPLTLGSVWTGCFIRELRSRAILPIHDPQFDEALGSLLDGAGGHRETAH
jgi:hypothetical protein